MVDSVEWRVASAGKRRRQLGVKDTRPVENCVFIVDTQKLLWPTPRRLDLLTNC